MKPIGGMNQYPFIIGGLTITAAKINGIEYVKNLYIHQQRSYNTFDLIDATVSGVYTFSLKHHTDSPLSLTFTSHGKSATNICSERIPVNDFTISPNGDETNIVIYGNRT